MRPLCIDLFCGLGGWSEGFLAEGYECCGFDVERHDYSRTCPMCKGTGICNGIPDCIACDRTGRVGHGGYPGQLVLQDILTLHGSQFRNADIIVASPPCQDYSHMAMPFSVGRRKAAWLRWDRDSPFGHKEEYVALNELFNACFRIQREVIEAAGRFIPLVVENVRGAQPWVGRSKYNYGSFHLWGDVPALMPTARQVKCAVDLNWSRKDGKPSLGFNTSTDAITHGRKVPMNFHEHEKTGKPGRSFQSAAVESQKQPVWFNDDKRKCGGDWFGAGQDMSLMRSMSSKSSARKAASAQIAKIPYALSSWIARVYKPTPATRACPDATVADAGPRVRLQTGLET